jgi:hypothetical protein
MGLPLSPGVVSRDPSGLGSDFKTRVTQHTSAGPAENRGVSAEI